MHYTREPLSLVMATVRGMAPSLLATRLHVRRVELGCVVAAAAAAILYPAKNKQCSLSLSHPFLHRRPTATVTVISVMN